MITTEADVTLEVLKGAKKLLETKGWVKGEYVNKDGYCLVGALSTSISKVAKKLGKYPEHHWGMALEQFIQSPSWASWNDHADRTKEEVLAVLDKAIEWESNHDHATS